MNMRSTFVRRSGLAVVAVAALWLGLAGCYPGEAPVSDIVATLHDPNKDFGTYATFTMPDSVVDAGDPDDAGYIEPSHEYDAAILARIRSNLTSRGWTEITRDSLNPPDVAILVTALVSETTNIWYYPPYWGWYGGWWGYYPPYWGYPCCYDVTTYTTGTISIDMAAVKDYVPTTETMPMPWAARLNGLANKSNATQSRIETAIDQAFAQSPYLDIQ